MAPAQQWLHPRCSIKTDLDIFSLSLPLPSPKFYRIKILKLSHNFQLKLPLTHSGFEIKQCIWKLKHNGSINDCPISTPHILPIPPSIFIGDQKVWNTASIFHFEGVWGNRSEIENVKGDEVLCPPKIWSTHLWVAVSGWGTQIGILNSLALLFQPRTWKLTHTHPFPNFFQASKNAKIGLNFWPQSPFNHLYFEMHQHSWDIEELCLRPSHIWCSLTHLPLRTTGLV